MTGVSPVEAGLRGLTLASVCLLVGLVPVAAYARRPAHATNAGPALARLGAIGALAATVCAVAAVVSIARLAEAIRVLTPGESTSAALAAALRSDLGGWTLLRVPAAVGLFVLLRAAWRAPGPVGAPDAAAAAMAVLLALTVAMTGHGAAGGPLAALVGVVHVAAGAVWLAGVVALAVAVPVALRALTAERRRDLLLRWATAFSRVAMVALAAAVLTGAARAALDGVGLAAIAGTSWGAAMQVKLWLFAAVLAAGLVNHRVLLRRLAAARGGPAADAPAGTLLFSVSVEVVLGVAVVAAAGVLVSAPQP